MKKRLFVLLCLLALPIVANAQVDHNFDVAAGDWETATNWDMGVTPALGDNAFINNDGEASLSNDTPILKDIGVGQGVGGIGILNHSGGTLESADGWVRIGGDGGVGEYNGSGTALLTQAHAGDAAGDGRIFVGSGGGGDGRATLVDTAMMSTSGEIVIGDAALGVMTMSNDSSIFGGTRVSIGQGDFADATLTLNDGAMINSPGWLNLGLGLGASAVLNINDSAEINVDAINMGNPDAVITVNQSGGSVTSNNWIGMGNFGGGSVEYDMTGGSLTSNADFMSIGEDGTATLTASGSAAITASSMAIGRNDNSDGTLILDGAGVSVALADLIVDANMNDTNAAAIHWIAGAAGVSTITSADNTDIGDTAEVTVDLALLTGWVSSGAGTSTTSLVLVDNGAAVVGEFVGLSEGSPVPGTNGATITYVGGGDGFDIVLQDIPITLGGPAVFGPDSFVITAGDFFSGGIAELLASDNADLSARRSNSDVASRVNVEFKGVSSIAAPTALSITVEASVFARTNVFQRIDLWNYDSGSWEEVDSRNAMRFSDSTTTIDATGDLSRFVEAGTNCVLARTRYLSDGNPRQRFSANVDQILWSIE